jgi:hypothetical protein
VLICGHNPGLDDLVDADWADLSPASAELVQLVRPRELD